MVTSIVRWVVGFTFLLGTASDSSAQQPPPAAPAAARVVSPRAVLAKRLADVRFDAAPLESALAALADLAGVQVYVRWQALEAAGLSRDLPVSLHLRNVRFQQALWMLLNEAAAGKTTLAWRCDDSLLTISTEEDFGQELVTQIYDIGDLTARRMRTSSMFSGRIHRRVTSVVPTVAAGAVGVTPVTTDFISGVDLESDDPTGDIDPDRDIEGPTPEEFAQQLADAIVSTIEPDSWTAAGGRGSISIFQGKLVVRNSPLVHQQIGGALRDARP